MKVYPIVVTLIIFCLTISVYGQDNMMNKQMNPVEETLWKMENQLWQDVKDHNMDDFKSHMMGDYRGVYADGIMNLDAEVNDIEKMKVDEYTISNKGFTMPADNVAILTYMVSVKGTYEDQEMSSDHNSTSVWVKKDGKWMVALHAQSHVPQKEMSHQN